MVVVRKYTSSCPQEMTILKLPTETDDQVTDPGEDPQTRETLYYKIQSQAMDRSNLELPSSINGHIILSSWLPLSFSWAPVWAISSITTVRTRISAASGLARSDIVPKFVDSGWWRFGNTKL